MCIKLCFKLHKTITETYDTLKLAFEKKQIAELKYLSGFEV